MKKGCLISLIVVGVILAMFTIVALIGMFLMDDVPSDAITSESETKEIEIVKTKTPEDYLRSLDTLLRNYKGMDRDDAIVIIAEANMLKIYGGDILRYSDVDTLSRLTKSLKTRLSKLQAREFPKLRKSYCDLIKKKLWVDNYEVKCYGKSIDHITFVNGIFANNANKQEFMNTLHEAFNVLRFKRVNFKWYEGEKDYTYYKIDSKKDSQISD